MCQGSELQFIREGIFGNSNFQILFPYPSVTRNFAQVNCPSDVRSTGLTLGPNGCVYKKLSFWTPSMSRGMNRSSLAWPKNILFTNFQKLKELDENKQRHSTQQNRLSPMLKLLSP